MSPPTYNSVGPHPICAVKNLPDTATSSARTASIVFPTLFTSCAESSIPWSSESLFWTICRSSIMEALGSGTALTYKTFRLRQIRSDDVG